MRQVLFIGIAEWLSVSWPRQRTQRTAATGYLTGETTPAFTLGEWVVVGVGDLVGVNPDDLDPDALLIATVQPLSVEATVVCDLWDLDGGTGEKRGELEANAHLIAAAPAMYAALKAAEEIIAQHFDDGCDDCRDALACIKDALAKAEGSA